MVSVKLHPLPSDVQAIRAKAGTGGFRRKRNEITLALPRLTVARLASPQGVEGLPPMRLPWVCATGNPVTLSKKAATYLKRFNHKRAAWFEPPEMTLAKVVSNLRCYFLQDADQTVHLIQSLFIPRTVHKWSPESVRVAWESVEGYVPQLGLSDLRAQAQKRKKTLEFEVADFLASTRPFGRIAAAELRAIFNDRHPDLNAHPKEFGMAVKVVSGLSSVSYQGVRCYYGISLPEASQQPCLAVPSQDPLAALKPSPLMSQEKVG